MDSTYLLSYATITDSEIRDVLKKFSSTQKLSPEVLLNVRAEIYKFARTSKQPFLSIERIVRNIMPILREKKIV